MKWGPKNAIKSEARVSRGWYLCAGCEKKVPATLPPKPGNKRRINNAVVDHIEPIIDPSIGFTTWDDVIERMFCEKDGLQLLCHACHTEKTAAETAIAKQRRANEKSS